MFSWSHKEVQIEDGLEYVKFEGVEVVRPVCGHAMSWDYFLSCPGLIRGLFL